MYLSVCVYTTRAVSLVYVDIVRTSHSLPPRLMYDNALALSLVSVVPTVHLTARQF